MVSHDAGSSIEDELRRPLPRRPRWRLESWRLWLRVAVFGPLTLALMGVLLHAVWLLVLALLGEEDGQPLTAALWLGMGVAPVVLVGCILMWGPLARELWLVRWGRPVRGRVRSRAQRGKFRTRCVVAYEYREMTQRGASLTLYGTASVPRDVFEAMPPGQALTVLHALWNPRWNVAYRFARFDAER